MTHLKSLGTWVRLPDGRTGHVVASGIDGLAVQIDGRLVTVKPSDVTPIDPPAAEYPEPQRSAQAPIQTSHEEPQFPSRPNPRGILVDGKWSEPQ
jgi:hypothetical protein